MLYNALPVNGFQYASIHAGFKKKKKDLALIYCPKGATTAATFTTNKTKAAPVVLSTKHMASESIKAVIINSGNANACTGLKGYQDALKTCEMTAELLNINPEEVLVSSTGVIGVPLPMPVMEKGIPNLVSCLNEGTLEDVAEGIMTTDTAKKTFTNHILLSESGKTARLSGIAKGSGMIHPNMATMLGFVMTDVAIESQLLKKLTKEIVDHTFNMVTVDGDTSTNDMFVVMASGALGNTPLTEASPDLPEFKAALLEIAKALSISIAKDGEGATKLLQVKLTGAKTEKDAKSLAKSVVGSSLVKAAFYGMDANWGRIICALGYADAHFNPEDLSLTLKSSAGEITLMVNGVGIPFDEDHALKVLSPDVIDICIALKDGDFEAEAWGCDLTYDYVKINGAYRT